MIVSGEIKQCKKRALSPFFLFPGVPAAALAYLPGKQVCRIPGPESPPRDWGCLKSIVGEREKVRAAHHGTGFALKAKIRRGGKCRHGGMLSNQNLYIKIRKDQTLNS